MAASARAWDLTQSSLNSFRGLAGVEALSNLHEHVVDNFTNAHTGLHTWALRSTCPRIQDRADPLRWRKRLEQRERNEHDLSWLALRLMELSAHAGAVLQRLARIAAHTPLGG